MSMIRLPFLPSRVALLAVACALLPAAIDAQSARRDRLALEDYLEWEGVQAPQLSPDGQHVVYVRTWVDKINDRQESSVWIMNADGTRNRSLVDGTNVRWSPDGQRIAYIAPGQPSGAQVWVRWMDAEGATSQVTHLTEAPAALEWSPDGKWIAFTMNQPKSEAWTVKLPAAPKGAKWVESPKVVTRLDYRQDRIGYTDGGYRHVFLVPADGGSPRQMTDGDWDHGSPKFSPDGRTLLVTGNRRADAEYAFRDSEIYAVDVASGAIAPLTSRKGPDGNPEFSPDGKLVAYTGYDDTGLDNTVSQLYVMNANGTGTRSLTRSLDRSPTSLIWATDGSGIYFNADDQGTTQLYFAPLAGAVRKLTSGAHVLNTSDIGRSGVAVGVRATADHPSDVVRFDVRRASEFTWLTAVNEDVLTGKKLASVEELWFTSADGLRVHGWIVKPPDFDPAKKYPLMLEIHGGPWAQYTTAFSFARNEHAANGYVILYTNPRGSTGYGQAFINGIEKSYPGKDFDDLMAGVDATIAKGYIDSSRMYVFGCSGGGVLTSWVVGHTTRFAAASANCPVTNWMSFAGQTDGPFWYTVFDKPFWEDPSDHLKRSPLMYVGNVKTPTMLMTGELDLRTPMPQTEEYYSALKYLKVPTAMIRFKEEWHGTSSRPSNFLRTQLYLRSWFDRWPEKKEPGKPVS